VRKLGIPLRLCLGKLYFGDVEKVRWGLRNDEDVGLLVKKKTHENLAAIFSPELIVGIL
jgi:hypothetical protein